MKDIQTRVDDVFDMMLRDLKKSHEETETFADAITGILGEIVHSDKTVFTRSELVDIIKKYAEPAFEFCHR